MSTARTAEERAGMPAAPAFFVWRIPGTAVNIRISLDAIRRIREYIAEVDVRSAEVGGLLIGDANRRGAEITEFAPVLRAQEAGAHFVLSDTEQIELRRYIAETNRRSSDKSVVGYFRSDLRSGVCLYEDDQKLIQNCFSDPSNVFLVVQPRQELPSTAGFFFWEGGSIFSSFSFMEFEFDEKLLASQAKSADDIALPAPDLNLNDDSPAKLVELTSERPIRKTPKSRRWAAVAFGSVAAMAGIGGYLYNSRTNVTRSDAPAPDVSRARSDTPAASLGLSVATSGAEINISWNAKSPQLYSARVALLTIEDGTVRRDMPLTKDQLGSSRLVYSPTTDTVHIALEAFGEDGKVTRESVIAMSNTITKAPTMQFETRVDAAIPKAEAPAEPKRAVREFVAPDVRVSRAAPSQTALAAAPPVELAGRVDLRQAGPPINQSLPPAAPVPAQQRNSPPPAAVPTQRMLLVTRGPQSPAVPVRQVRPQLPDNVKAMLTSRSSVKVRVQVDASGRVTAADALAANGSLEQFLGAAAASAARLWVFQPATDGDRKVASELTVEFTFLPERPKR